MELTPEEFLGEMRPEELQSILYGEPDAHEYQEGPPDGIDDEEANYHVRRAAALQGEAAWVKSMFDTEIEGLKERRDRRLRILETKAEWHSRAVESWHRRRLAADKKAKTIHLPGGTSSLRRSQPVLVIEDEERFRAWASTVKNEVDGADRTLEDLIFPRKPREMSRGALRKFLKPGSTDSEPGTPLDTVNPETGAKAEGLGFRAVGETHNIKEG